MRIVCTAGNRQWTGSRPDDQEMGEKDKERTEKRMGGWWTVLALWWWWW